MTSTKVPEIKQRILADRRPRHITTFVNRQVEAISQVRTTPASWEDRRARLDQIADELVRFAKEPAA